ncbi:hypothetical protein GFL21_14905 [Rhizobium anhuiense]|uniref:hypothetical protein n=1 Tax=Rhizobium anhuiense TaxID=1184720 RepID=UPI001441BC2D|nr:hypothetical protein [Rhizobium anhuiense]NKM55804.1 hypothetical protein [Rhizobium anhuiense]
MALTKIASAMLDGDAGAINPPIDVPALITTNRYGADTGGRTSHSLTANDSSDLDGLERYTLFVGNYSAGTGDDTVVGSTYGLGVSAIKDDWQSTPVKGQMHGISVVTRGGYSGVNTGDPFVFGGGDTAAIVTNTVQADSDNFAAILEGVSYFMPGGAQVAGTKGVRVQLGALKNSISLGIGVLAIAAEGPLGAAFQAQTGTGPTAIGTWEEFLAYYTNFGAGAYKAFSVNQLGNIVMDNGPAAAAPNQKKMIRVGTGGAFEVVNSAMSAVIASVSDAGLLTSAYAFDIPKRSSAPAAAQGRLWFDTTVGKLKVCEDSINWKTVTTS